MALLGGSANSSRADVLASYTTNGYINNGPQAIGQSFITTSTKLANHIVFNLFAYDASIYPVLSPYAIGTGYLFSQAYVGTPAGLSSSAPGFLGQAAASGNYYTFDSTLTLAPNTAYYFYEDTLIPGSTVLSGTTYTSSRVYSRSTATNYVTSTSDAVNFQVTGSPVTNAVPEIGGTALLLGLGLAGLLAAQRAFDRIEVRKLR